MLFLLLGLQLFPLQVETGQTILARSSHTGGGLCTTGGSVRYLNIKLPVGTHIVAQRLRSVSLVLGQGFFTTGTELRRHPLMERRGSLLKLWTFRVFGGRPLDRTDGGSILFTLLQIDLFLHRLNPLFARTGEFVLIAG